jgi:hypothetical protein
MFKSKGRHAKRKTPNVGPWFALYAALVQLWAVAEGLRVSARQAGTVES